MPRPPWPYEEAQKILTQYGENPEIVLETGYGPSGAPHIGTFAEVARTTWVGQALADLSGKPWRLIAFSDDMDGLRKVPLNMPKDALEPHLGKPLSLVPDPFGCHASYGAHNNARLREMLDRFGFVYDFRSSHQQYASGAFNEGLARIMASYDRVRDIILPTIREEKRRDWSPFFPICEKCGRINGTRVTGRDGAANTITYLCEGEQAGAIGDEPESSDSEEGADARVASRPSVSGCGHSGSVSIFDGHAKVGWKVDWALRWHALGVHYEMYGKDLIESAALSGRICKVLGDDGKRGPRGPVQSFYEMFLDEEGRKISKSVGRGLTIDTWLSYAPRESLLHFIFREPRKARKLSWEVVTRSVDEYLQTLQKRYEERGGVMAPATTAPREGAWREALDFIQPSLPERCPYDYPVTYSMLFQLVSALCGASPDVIKGYVHHYKGALPASDAALEALIHYAATYVRDQILPARAIKTPSTAEGSILMTFAQGLRGGQEADAIQSIAFDVARAGGMDPREFFRVVYNALTGQESGPRLGPFIQLLGEERAAHLLKEAAGRAAAAS